VLGDSFSSSRFERTHSGVHGSVTDRASLKVGVDDVGGAEADEGHAAVDVLEVVVGVGDVQLAGVLGGVAVAVADERGLVVVVEVGVAAGKKKKESADIARGRTVRDISLT
jgi:hypothetical protein